MVQPGFYALTDGDSAVVAADAQGRIYVVGGTAADGTAVASAERFGPATGTWSAIPSPGSNFTAATTDHLGRIYAVCEGAIMVPAALRRFDPALGTWETLGAGSFRGSQAVTADTAGRLYASGGTAFMGDSERVFSQYDPSRGPRGPCRTRSPHRDAQEGAAGSGRQAERGS